MYTTFILYFMSVVAFVLFGIDKRRATSHRDRIPEFLLLLPCILCGAFGGLMGMLLFWHKVRKPLFLILVPLLFLLQWGIGWYLIHYVGI